MKVRGWFALSALGVVLALAGCSRADPSIIADSTGGQDIPTGDAPAAVDVAAEASGLVFQQTTLNGPADQAFTVNFSNPAALQHNWVLVEPGQDKAVADAAKATGGNPLGLEGVIAGGAPIANGAEPVQVPPTAAGDYPYICTVPGHYEAGMKGTMTLGAQVGTTGEPADAAPASAVEGASAAAAPTGGGDADSLTASADPSGALKFQQTTMQAPAGGEFTVNFANTSPLPHNWVLVEPDQADAVAQAAQATGGDPTGIAGVIAGGKPISGSSETVKVPPQQPGTYPYICTVPGHYQAGMKGELTVGP